MCVGLFQPAVLLTHSPGLVTIQCLLDPSATTVSAPFLPSMSFLSVCVSLQYHEAKEWHGLQEPHQCGTRCRQPPGRTVSSGLCSPAACKLDYIHLLCLWYAVTMQWQLQGGLCQCCKLRAACSYAVPYHHTSKTVLGIKHAAPCAC
jgi:hypothetical protein